MGFLCSFAEAPIGRLRHHANELRERHCHDDPFVAVVLSGGYQEAGDEGRWNVRPGDVLIHHAFESHLDRFDHRGAEVLVLPVPHALSQSRTMRGRVADPDLLVRLAERDLGEAQASLAGQFASCTAAPLDWPDALAADLRAMRDIPLGQWAEQAGVRQETLSRGFRLAYGCTPKAYRANARARAAVSALRGTDTPFAAVAQQLGYADQAHMTRAVTMLTGLTPGGWRRRSNGFNTGAGAAP
ncbi:AraC family transcriptional regulator [Sphingomonas koreensis]|jgi:AraC-like DNA-binding protein|uniref:AraC family transcriptional regulator n=1 Tax=Sphingomonas koreensis TaxID=93064 RepID=A0A430FZS3_9SPHN|nr:AraC family transcriptional regulator [Sphingomonas koreensis]MDC7810426.1 AraC family transcriptional regulator [Sphingomonas koreensis]RSU17463.1 AraC family transcriptional regulator [Sphingomonas koreensis]RSU19995.1 AraC family transcriptional regulator [Sphingomonas koreensis]RSU26162.1 AraC family transcriptional regulator [Sphingomonas koreensis]RSU29476.1 AraC family transcriptional regulator [Sphingomonas koreensis]